MHRAWLSIGVIALASTGCSHPQINTGVAPAGGTVRDGTSANETATALYVIDGMMVTPPIAPARPDASPLLVIDGVPVGSPAP
jgi:hypothetical protein